MAQWLIAIFMAAAASLPQAASCEPQAAAAPSADAAEAELARLERRPDSEWQAFEARWDGVRAAMTAPIENLQLPIEYWPDGSIKARIFAEKAQIFDSGKTVFAENVRVEMLDRAGKRDGELKADGCLFDKPSKRGYCRGRASIKRDGDEIRGRGVYFSADEEFIRILADCEIRTRRMAGKTFGGI